MFAMSSFSIVNGLSKADFVLIDCFCCLSFVLIIRFQYLSGETFVEFARMTKAILFGSIFDLVFAGFVVSLTCRNSRQPFLLEYVKSISRVKLANLITLESNTIFSRSSLCLSVKEITRETLLEVGRMWFNLDVNKGREISFKVNNDSQETKIIRIRDITIRGPSKGTSHSCWGFYPLQKPRPYLTWKIVKI